MAIVVLQPIPFITERFGLKGWRLQIDGRPAFTCLVLLEHKRKGTHDIAGGQTDVDSELETHNNRYGEQ